MTGLSKEEIETICQRLNIRQNTASSPSSTYGLSLVDDYTSDEEDSSPSPTKRGRGRPKKTVLKKEPIIKRSAGRPKKIRTIEELAKEKADAVMKSQRNKDREAKKVQKAEDARQTQLRVAARTKAAQDKQAEKAQKALELVKKRTEIYGKMLADAEAYKEKWNL